MKQTKDPKHQGEHTCDGRCLKLKKNLILKNLATIMTEKDIKGIVVWVKNNWEKIPDNFKTNLRPDKYKGNIFGLSLENHIVVLLIDRQKPSKERNYDFDEERIGVTKNGQIVWGFDSGCSCPTPWNDNYPNCYTVARTWKEFKTDGFDLCYLKEANNKIKEIKKQIQKGERPQND